MIGEASEFQEMVIVCPTKWFTAGTWRTCAELAFGALVSECSSSQV